MWTSRAIRSLAIAAGAAACIVALNASPRQRLLIALPVGDADHGLVPTAWGLGACLALFLIDLFVARLRHASGAPLCSRCDYELAPSMRLCPECGHAASPLRFSSLALRQTGRLATFTIMLGALGTAISIIGYSLPITAVSRAVASSPQMCTYSANAYFLASSFHDTLTSDSVRLFIGQGDGGLAAEWKWTTRSGFPLPLFAVQRTWLEQLNGPFKSGPVSPWKTNCYALAQSADPAITAALKSVKPEDVARPPLRARPDRIYWSGFLWWLAQGVLAAIALPVRRSLA